MATAMTAEPPATPEEIWAILRETALRQKEIDKIVKETSEQMQETDRRQKETDRIVKETSEQMKETDRLVKENAKQVGGLSNSFGKLTEHLVGPGVVRRFYEAGYHFDGIKSQRLKIRDDEGSVRAEIDLLLENADTIIAVEIKSRPDQEENFLERHVRRLEILREHREAIGEDPKRILGAIAGAIFDGAAKKATQKAGFFVMEQSGDTMRMDVPANFKPREW